MSTEMAEDKILTEPQISLDTSKNELYLSDMSPKDKPWDNHKEFSETVQAHYSGSKFERYAERMSLCSELLQFVLTATDDDSIRLKLRSASFCRVRHCPVCQWRRSLTLKAKAHKILPKITLDYPSHRWLFLTLTQRNVPIIDLRETLIQMNSAFQRMSQRVAFPAVGWLRSTEVTRGQDGNAHPHFHCLLMVPAGYFSGKKYLNQAKWVALWRDCLRVDYDPVLDIRAVRREINPDVLVPEIIKYCVKESDMVADREWFIELTDQLHNMRAIATGGILKKYLRDLEQEPEDLIGVGEDELGEDFGEVLFGWKTRFKKYKLVD